MRRAAIEVEKIVTWAIGVVLAIIILIFIGAQLSTGDEGIVGAVGQLLGDIFKR